MLMAIGVGWLVGWGLTKLIVKKWPRWWVAILTVLGTSVLLLAVGFSLALIEKTLGDSDPRRFGAVVSWVWLGGTFCSIWTAISVYRKRGQAPAIYHAYDRSQNW